MPLSMGGKTGPPIYLIDDKLMNQLCEKSVYRASVNHYKPKAFNFLFITERKVQVLLPSRCYQHISSPSKQQYHCKESIKIQRSARKR